jgi:hypothetical protein
MLSSNETAKYLQRGRISSSFRRHLLCFNMDSSNSRRYMVIYGADPTNCDSSPNAGIRGFEKKGFVSWPSA